MLALIWYGFPSFMNWSFAMSNEGVALTPVAVSAAVEPATDTNKVAKAMIWIMSFFSFPKKKEKKGKVKKSHNAFNVSMEVC